MLNNVTVAYVIINGIYCKGRERILWNIEMLQ
jgi:hypothetical protein